MDRFSARWRKPKGRLTKRKKALLNNFKANVSQSNEETSNIDVPKQTEDYKVVDITALSNLFQEVECSGCKMKSLTLASSSNNFGYCSKLTLNCSSCGLIAGTSYTSQRAVNSNRFDINNKMVSAFIEIGKGYSALETFSMAIGMPTMDSKTFRRCFSSVVEKKSKLKAEMFEISRETVRKVYREADSSIKEGDIIDLSVSYDGTWQKRGHTSLYGIGIVIETITGLVIDFEILSKYCHECVTCAKDLGENSMEYKLWSEGHAAECEKNFNGSSNSMEMSAALCLWKRSLEYSFRYTTILSDGDTKTYDAIVCSNVYGSNNTIKKEECLNHVAKRVGTGLRNKVKEWRAKGVTLGGRKCGSLKEETIVKLQGFYQKAIKANAPSISQMKTAIFATLFHCMSTDEKPQHQKCPTGKESWCFYQRAIACGERPKKHSTMKTRLSEDIVAKILPVYQRLASDKLLERCTQGKTQNANECLHSCIWNKCSKETFVSKTRLDIAVTTAVSEFNLGCAASLQLCSSNTLLAENVSLAIAEKKDQRRAAQKRNRQSSEYKQKRLNKKYKKNKDNMKIKTKEGPSYIAGGF